MGECEDDIILPTPQQPPIKPPRKVAPTSTVTLATEVEPCPLSHHHPGDEDVTIPSTSGGDQPPHPPPSPPPPSTVALTQTLVSVSTDIDLSTIFFQPK